MTELIVDLLAVVGLLAIVFAVLLFLADDPPPASAATRHIELDVLRAQRRIHDLASLSAQLMVAESRKHRRDLK
jgi:hypothetical protein